MTTYTYQPDATAGIDAYVDSSVPTTNNGTAITIRASAAGAASKVYAHLKFTQLRDAVLGIPTSETCVGGSATITLWGAQTFLASHIFEFLEALVANDGWTETGVTYNTKDGAAAWAGGSNGGAVSGTDVAATAWGSYTTLGTEVTDTAMVFTLNSTALAALDAYRIGASRDLHLVLRGDTTGGQTWGANSFRASDSSSANKPKLIINTVPLGTAIDVSGSASVYTTQYQAYLDFPYTYTGTAPAPTAAIAIRPTTQTLSSVVIGASVITITFAEDQPFETGMTVVLDGTWSGITNMPTSATVTATSTKIFTIPKGSASGTWTSGGVMWRACAVSIDTTNKWARAGHTIPDSVLNFASGTGGAWSWADVFEGIPRLAANTAYTYRITWTNAPGITGTNPFTGTLTTLALRSVNDAQPHFAPMFTQFKPMKAPSTPLTSGVTDQGWAASAIDYANWLAWTQLIVLTHHDETTLAAIRALSSAQFVARTNLYKEIPNVKGSSAYGLGNWIGLGDGTTDPGHGIATTSALWDELNAQETWFLHQNPSTTTRGTHGSMWELYFGSQACLKRFYRRFLENNKLLHSTFETNANKRYDPMHFFDNNVDGYIVDQTPTEYASSGIATAREDTKRSLRLLNYAGSSVGGNNLVGSPGSASIAEALAAEQMVTWKERWATGYTSGGATVFQSKANWLLDLAHAEALIAQTPVKPICLTVQLGDNTHKGPNPAHILFGYASHLLVWQPGRSYARFVQAGGYEYLWTIPEMDLNLGTPTGARTTDVNGNQRRDFTLGNVIVNGDSVSHGGVAANTAVITQTAAAAPTISSVSPASGSNVSNVTITVTGTGFVSGAVVKRASTNLTTTFVNAATLTAVVPSGTGAGTYDITVTNPDTQTVTATNAYTVNAAAAPTLSTVSPTSGSNAAPVTITLTGTGFVSGAVVTLDTLPLDTTFVSSTSLTAVVPLGTALDTYDVTVTNPDTQHATKVDGYQATGTAAPTVGLTGVTPARGTTSAATTLTVTGTNFVSGAVVALGSVNLATTFGSSTSLTASVPSGTAAGAYDVTVTNPDTQHGTLAGAFVVSAPASSSRARRWYVIARRRLKVI